MIYNKTHDRYDIGLGLCFQFKFNHVEFGNTIVVVSNIPEINLIVLKSRTTLNALDEVQQILLNYFTHKVIALVNKLELKDKSLDRINEKASPLNILKYGNQEIPNIIVPINKESAKEVLDDYYEHFKIKKE